MKQVIHADVIADEHIKMSSKVRTTVGYSAFLPSGDMVTHSNLQVHQIERRTELGCFSPPPA